MTGTRNGEAEPASIRPDTSIACSPGCGSVLQSECREDHPIFCAGIVVEGRENTLVAAMLMPNVLETTIGGSKVKIGDFTQYPYENQLTFKITLDKPAIFTLKIRKPSWVTQIQTVEKFTEEDGYIMINRTFLPQMW